jgi:hypothetical protein
MPYKMHEDGDAWIIVNEETGDTKARHEPPDAKEKAERQLRLLNAIENDPNWEEKHDG